MYILGLRGRKGSGKDFTAKEVLVPEYSASTYAFADELRRQVIDSYGLTMEQLTDRHLKDHPLSHYPVNPKDPLAKVICQFFENNKAFPYGNGFNQGTMFWTPRLIMIAEGQFKRAIDPLYWVNFVVRKIHKEKPVIAVVTDVRFPETEGLYLKEKVGAKIVNIVRPGVELLNDPSETLMENWPHFDAEWNNSSDYRTLSSQVERSFSSWGWDVEQQRNFRDYVGHC